uniref:Uncharacterized protein n=1 Tax=Ciona intestinalis TaxID=7719 RepID=F6X8K6_CIOIN
MIPGSSPGGNIFYIIIFNSSRSVVVITFALHAKGPRFEPGRKHF